MTYLRWVPIWENIPIVRGGMYPYPAFANMGLVAIPIRRMAKSHCIAQHGLRRSFGAQLVLGPV